MNTTDSAVRITHLPTGTVVAMQDEKSQIQNRAKAMVVLRARLLKAEQDRQAAEMSAQRRGQVGAGSRTDKIRTYNYKENRVTDHRINLTLYKLDQVLAGDLTELTDALMADKRARQLAGEEDGADGARPARRAVGRRAEPPALGGAPPRGPLHRRRGRSESDCGARAAVRRPAGLAAGAVAAARAMAARRAAGEPLQYVFGHWPFRTLDLLVDRRVLIPRPETEQVVEVALGEAPAPAPGWPTPTGPTTPVARGLVAVDAGTGTGAIALSLATELGAGRSARGLGHRRQRRRARRGGGEPRRRASRCDSRPCPPSRWSRATGSSRCRRGCAARSTWSSRTRPT